MLLSMESWNRWHLRLIALGVLLMGLWAATSSAEADFCETEVLHDYRKPLKRLPAVPAPPLDERLDFAPARTYLGSFSNGPLQVGPGKRGFSLGYSPYEQSPPPSRRLDWQITSRLVMVDRSGSPIGRPRQIEKQVKRLWPDDENHHRLAFAFEVPGKPALYRLEIVFKNKGGKRLARFGEHFRVLRPSLNLDFFLNGTSFRRGETVQAWLVNRGVTFLSFGLGKRIEYWNGTSWTFPPVKFPGGPVLAIGLNLGPGERTTCWSTAIPADAMPGTYRFVTDVDRSVNPVGYPATPLDASAEFTVTE